MYTGTEIFDKQDQKVCHSLYSVLRKVYEACGSKVLAVEMTWGCQLLEKEGQERWLPRKAIPRR